MAASSVLGLAWLSTSADAATIWSSVKNPDRGADPADMDMRGSAPPRLRRDAKPLPRIGVVA
jgi:hypothetical protein